MMDTQTIRAMADDAAKKAARLHKRPYVPFDEAEIEKMPPFPFPFLGDYVPKGWKKIEELFCDTSGLDASGPAMPVPVLIDRMKADLQKKETIGYGITEVGQFQAYLGVYEKEKGTRKGAKKRQDRFTEVQRASLLVKIGKYAHTFAEAFVEGVVGEPGFGDCLYCGMHAEKVSAEGRAWKSAKNLTPRKPGELSLGEQQKDTSHLAAHVKEGYLVPSLLARVIEKNLDSFTRKSAMDYWRAVVKNGSPPKVPGVTKTNLARDIEDALASYLRASLAPENPEERT